MATHRVAVLVRPGLLPMEMGIPHQLFGGAETADGQRLYEVVTCAAVPGQLRTTADVTVNVTAGPEVLDTADTVIVPASDLDYEPTAGPLEPELAAALDRVRPGTRIASLCTGAFVLAAAGILDGRQATTHWRSVKDFRRLYPNVELRPDVLYTDCDGVLTSAGVAAGVDLCVHMIRADHGAAVATAVACRTVVPPHRAGGQAQYVSQPIVEPHAASTMRAREWALSQLHRPLSLRELAERESMSARNFTRKFRQEVGVSPLVWLIQQRVARARELLEETDMTVEWVAREAGFGTGASLRQRFQDELGVAPRDYRATFRGTV